ncbi:MAG TPA: hypothetical protein VLY63_22950 [Anaerolineae bacterium]|nr:hypothetical protein [Anaerolineae bacterium]
MADAADAEKLNFVHASSLKQEAQPLGWVSGPVLMRFYASRPTARETGACVLERAGGAPSRLAPGSGYSVMFSPPWFTFDIPDVIH